MLTPLNKPKTAPRRPARARGFTLIEMLVVVVIIIGLLSILVPAITSVPADAGRAAEQKFLAAMQMALAAYNLDFNDYPPSKVTGDIGGETVTNWDGGEIVVQALIGPLNTAADGHNGYGFKVGGKRYGPYMTIEHENSLVERVAGRWVLTMVSSQSKKPFLYYRAVTTDMTKPNGEQGVTGAINDSTANKRIWGTNGRFDKDHNNTLDASDDPTEFWRNSAPDDEAKSFTMSLRAAKYLLVSPGPDEEFGDNTDDDNPGDPDTYLNNLDYDDQRLTGP